MRICITLHINIRLIRYVCDTLFNIGDIKNENSPIFHYDLGMMLQIEDYVIVCVSICELCLIVVLCLLCCLSFPLQKYPFLWCMINIKNCVSSYNLIIVINIMFHSDNKELSKSCTFEFILNEIG